MMAFFWFALRSISLALLVSCTKRIASESPGNGAVESEKGQASISVDAQPSTIAPSVPSSALELPRKTEEKAGLVFGSDTLNLNQLSFKFEDKHPICSDLSPVTKFQDHLSILTSEKRYRVPGELGFFTFNHDQVALVARPHRKGAESLILVAPTADPFGYPTMARMIGELQEENTVIGILSPGASIFDKDGNLLAVSGPRPGPLVYGSSLDVFLEGLACVRNHFKKITLLGWSFGAGTAIFSAARLGRLNLNWIDKMAFILPPGSNGYKRFKYETEALKRNQPILTPYFEYQVGAQRYFPINEWPALEMAHAYPSIHRAFRGPCQVALMLNLEDPFGNQDSHVVMSRRHLHASCEPKLYYMWSKQGPHDFFDSFVEDLPAVDALRDWFKISR
jgi:hypothetical protein